MVTIKLPTQFASPITYSIPIANVKIYIIVHPQNPENSFFMSFSIENEIRFLIDSLNTKKAIRKLDVETKFFKFGEVLISDTLSKFFNKFIEESILIYPWCLKIDEGIPLFEMVIDRWLQITELFRCYLNLRNYLKN